VVTLVRCSIRLDKEVFEIPNNISNRKGRVVDFLVILGTLSTERVLCLPRYGGVTEWKGGHKCLEHSMPVFPIDPSLLEHSEFGLESLSWSNVGHAVYDFLATQPFLKAKLVARKAQNLQLVTEFLTHFVEKFVAGGGQASRACSVTHENGLALQGVQVQLAIFHEVLCREPSAKQARRIFGHSGALRGGFCC